MFSDSPDVVNRSFRYLLISRALRSSALIFVTLSLPLYLHFLHFSLVFISLIYIPIIIFNVVLVLILGRLGDKIGYSKILILGEAFPVVGLLLLAISTNIYVIAIGAIIAGITGGAGGMRGAFSPGMTAFIANNYPGEGNRVNRLSLLTATASFFSIFGGLFLSLYGIISSAIGILLFYRVFFIVSFLLVFGSLIALSRLHEYRRPKKTTKIMKKASFKYLLRIILPNSINAAAIGIAMPLLPLFFELKFHVDPGTVGNIYTIAYAATAIGSYTSGKFINGRVDSLKMASIAHILQRAYDTANIISNYVGLDVKIDDRLREVYLGNANGHNINEFLDTLYPNSHITGKVRDSLGMETWEHLQVHTFSLKLHVQL